MCSLKVLTNSMLLCTYRKACSLNLSQDFIKILETELHKRDIDYQKKPIEVKSQT
ncbi:sporulation histidine kinase inhibitor Sda [Bacillus sp. JJ1503]|uniref:sporulation histidine kinase inhibitor Sda n=1 Tax=unclassified Bacillus (in: firmicutes) TaxID=185979 RepID=UPI003F68FA39